MDNTVSIFWHRRDLRIFDNAGLYRALSGPHPVLPVFIFDTDILDKLEDKYDARVTFIHQQIANIKDRLQEMGSDIKVFYGKPVDVFLKIISQYRVKEVYTNNDYEPYAIARDLEIKNLLHAHGIDFKSYKDHCIFEKDEILKDDGKPYTVYTPYSKKWRLKLNDYYLQSYPNENYYTNYVRINTDKLIGLEQMGFKKSSLAFPPLQTTEQTIIDYSQKRDYPALNGTSRFGVHFRFGTISIREKARNAMQLSHTWINELIWREFYMQILFHFPHVVTKAFKPEYDKIVWRNNEDEFNLWCNGQTGYPIVDAGMRELNATGYMHNRTRMIVASFLTKNLLIDWRWGEAYFAKKLLDFDLCSNNGGWQWAAGSGTDAAPYFRIFNPALQTEKFDKDLTYIKHWVPEFGTDKYPKPIVSHDFARGRCLEAYKVALSRT